MTLSWQQVLSHKYQYQYQYRRSKYQYKYQYLAFKYKYKYQYTKIVLKYRSSTSTSTQNNKTVCYPQNIPVAEITVVPHGHEKIKCVKCAEKYVYYKP